MEDDVAHAFKCIALTVGASSFLHVDDFARRNSGGVALESLGAFTKVSYGSSFSAGSILDLLLLGVFDSLGIVEDLYLVVVVKTIDSPLGIALYLDALLAPVLDDTVLTAKDVALVGKTYKLRLLISRVALEVVAVLVGILFRLIDIDIAGIALITVQVREFEGRAGLLEVINEGSLIGVGDGDLRDGSLLENEEGNIAIETSLAIVVSCGVNGDGSAGSIGRNAAFEHGALYGTLGLGAFGVVIAESLLTFDFGSGGVFNNDLAAHYESVNDKVASLAEIEAVGSEVLNKAWVAYPHVALIGESDSL